MIELVAKSLPWIAGGGVLMALVAWLARGFAKRRADDLEARALTASFEREAIAEAEQKKKRLAAQSTTTQTEIQNETNEELERRVNE